MQSILKYRWLVLVAALLCGSLAATASATDRFDNFNGYADGTSLTGGTYHPSDAGSDWVGSGWQINANRAYGTGGGTVVLSSGMSDCKVQATAKQLSSGFSEIVFRSNSGRTQYLRCSVSSTTVR